MQGVGTRGRGARRADPTGELELGCAPGGCSRNAGKEVTGPVGPGEEWARASLGGAEETQSQTRSLFRPHISELHVFLAGAFVFPSRIQNTEGRT